MADLADCIRKYFVNQYDYQYGFSKGFWFQILHNTKIFSSGIKKHLIISNQYIHCISAHVHLAIMFMSIIANGHLEYVGK